VWGVRIFGNEIFAGSCDQSAFNVWDYKTGLNTGVYPNNESNVWCIYCHKNYLVCGSEHVFLYERQLDSTYKLIRKLVVGFIVSSVYIDDTKIVCGSYGSVLKVWDFPSCNLQYTLAGHKANIRCIAVKDNIVVSASNDMTAKIWDLTTGQCMNTLIGHNGAVMAVCYDGCKVITGSLDRHIKIWNAISGQIYTTIPMTYHIYALALNSNILVTGDGDSCVKILDFSKA